MPTTRKRSTKRAQPSVDADEVLQDDATNEETLSAGEDQSEDQSELQAPGGTFDGWQWIKSLTPKHWDSLVCYVYRFDPYYAIDKTAGKPVYTDKIGQAFDEQFILEAHGSGEYQFQFTQGKNRVKVFKVYLFNMKYPPRLPIGDWLKNPRNAKWTWCEPLLRAQEAQAEAQGNAAAANPAGSPAQARDVFGMVKDVVSMIRGEGGESQGLAAQLVAKMDSNQQAMIAAMDPLKQMETIRTMMEMFAPKKDTESASILDKMFEQQKESAREAREEAKYWREKAMAPPPPPPPVQDPLTMLTETLPKLEGSLQALGFRRGGTSKEAPTDWGAIAMSVLDKASPILEGFVGYLNRPQPQQQPQPYRMQPQPTITAQAQAQPQPHAQPTGAQPADMGQQQQQPQNPLMKYEAQLEEAAPFLMDIFRNKQPGTDFRDWFRDRLGESTWQNMRIDVPQADLFQAICAHNILAWRMGLNQPENQQRLQVFISELYSDPTPDEGDDEPEAAGGKA